MKNSAGSVFLFDVENKIPTPVNLKQGIGKRSEYSIKVIKYYTDLDHKVVDKSVITGQLANPLPFLILGDNEINGGFINFRRSIKQLFTSVYFINAFVVGKDYIPFETNPSNDIKNLYDSGDLIYIFTDNTNYCYIILSARPNAYSLMIKNVIQSDYLSIFSANTYNLDTTIYFITTNVDGYKQDSLSFISNNNPSLKNKFDRTLNVKLKFDSSKALYTFIYKDSDSLTFKIH